MASFMRESCYISGFGVSSAIGQGQMDFASALLSGAQRFRPLKKEGRQLPTAQLGSASAPFIGAEIDDLRLPDWIPASALRTASYSARVAVTTLAEAWDSARLSGVDPERIGLIIGGTNLQQRELSKTWEDYRERMPFLRPTYGLTFLDTDICGICTDLLGIKGPSFSIGGASASGQLALIQAAQAVQAGSVDVCIALGGLMDLSAWELQALMSLGAMGSPHFSDQPALACRPFDRQRDGFIFGEACAALVVERKSTALRREIEPYAKLSGWSVNMDANRNPNPSVQGECKAIQQALAVADWRSSDIDYVNPHGTASPLGDETELKALLECDLANARINTTKSITGHGLTAAGALEVVAVLVQMATSTLHPSLNLVEPISDVFSWVRQEAEGFSIKRALKTSMGFGGMNTAVCLENYRI